MQPPEYQPFPAPPDQPPAYPPAPTAEPQPPAYPPAPEAPPYYGQPSPPAPPRRRSLAPIIAIIAVVLVLVIAAGGYFVAGTAYASSRVDAAGKTYNQVIDNENKLTTLFNTLQSQFGTIDTKNPTHATISQAKTVYAQLVTQSQDSIPQIDSDTQLLSTAGTKLKDNQWLTALSRSDLDARSAKIADLAAALAQGRMISTDLVQYGNFIVALLASIDDLLTIGEDASAHDLVGTTTAIGKMKTDVANGIQLDQAPGLAPDVDQFMHDLQSAANDFVALFSAAAAGNRAGLTQAEKALNSDSTKLDSYDSSAWATQADSYYGNLIDQYNALIDKANKA
jgi:hypothetical protein